MAHPMNQSLRILRDTAYINLQDTLDKLTHFPPQLSDFVPLKNEFDSLRAQTD